ncbi:MAG: guanylate kinase [Clostridiales bacterium]|nr:guanylate kinase [Clostridiales bacterium]
MSNKKRGTFVLYSGSSGVGKGTIMAELLKRDPSIRLSVSNTTRSPREGEIDGVHYNFVTKEQFKKLIDEDGYLEYAQYCDNYYGTPKKQVEDLLNEGYNVFLEIEVQGALQIMAKYPDVLSIFILPTSIESLNRRLHRRGTESEETINERLAQAQRELTYKDRYKYNVVNDDLDAAVNEVLDILHKEASNNLNLS